MMMASHSQPVQLCGSTELRLERHTVGWGIRGASHLFQMKLLPIWKIKSPSFTAGPGPQTWHLELLQSKNEFVKCILVQDGADGLGSSNTTENIDSCPVTSKTSEMLQSAAQTEFTSGAIINNLFMVTREGMLESFSDILSKYEETNGWREWAGKFVEKRRKAGITEYIFGNDGDAYENALPMTYLAENQVRFLDDDGVLHLQAELLFTKTAEIPVLPNADANSHALTPVNHQKILSNEQLAQRLVDYLTTKHYSDLTLVAGDQTFHVHKIILEARAPKLAACLLDKLQQLQKFTSSCEESGSNETSGDGTVIKTKKEPEILMIENMNPITFHQILHFIYSGSISTTDICILTNLCRESRKFDFHELTYSCILKTLEVYQNCPPDLKLLALESLKEMLENCDETVFKDRAVKLEELARLYPYVFQSISLPIPLADF